MFRKRFYFITCLILMTSSVLVEGLPKPINYLSEMRSYLTKRFRRNAVNFHRAIACHQPDIMILGTYGTYGCFCGFSGFGKPIDETDKCCQRHDQCYEEAGSVEKTIFESVISLAGNIFQSYHSECREGKVICDNNSPYQDKLCNCDKEAAYCFHVASSTYHPQLMGIDTGKYCSENSTYDNLNLTENENRYHTTPVTTPAKYDRESTEENKAYMQTTPQRKFEKEVVVPRIILPKEEKPYNGSVRIVPIVPTISSPNETKIEILEPKQHSKNRIHTHHHANSHVKTTFEEPRFDVEPNDIERTGTKSLHTSFNNGSHEIHDKLEEGLKPMKLQASAKLTARNLGSQSKVKSSDQPNSAVSLLRVRTFNLWLSFSLNLIWLTLYM